MARRGVLTIGGVLLAAGLVVPTGASAAALRGPATDVSAKGYRYVSDSFPVADNDQEANAVSCPGDEPVVGGGVSTEAPYDYAVVVNTSRPFDDDLDGRLDDGWIAYVDNINSGDPMGSTFRTYAICDKRAEENDYRYKTSAPTAAPEGQQSGVAAYCPKEEPVVSGGSSSSGSINDEMHVNTTQPLDTEDSGARPEDGWIAYVDNVNVGNPKQVISAFAICDKRRRTNAYAYKTHAETAPDEEQTQSPAQCGGTTRLVAGGMRSSGVFTQRMRATSSYPTDAGGTIAPETWIAKIDNFAGGGNFQSLTSFAICRK